MQFKRDFSPAVYLIPSFRLTYLKFRKIEHFRKFDYLFIRRDGK